MSWIYKIIKEKNPSYEKEMEMFKDKPELQEDIPTHLYRIGEVDFDSEEEKLSGPEIMKRIKNWTIYGACLDKYESKEELINTLKMMIKDIEDFPEVLERDENAKFYSIPDFDDED